jgi:hypothetical protein
MSSVNTICSVRSAREVSFAVASRSHDEVRRRADLRQQRFVIPLARVLRIDAEHRVADACGQCGGIILRQAHAALCFGDHRFVAERAECRDQGRTHQSDV